MTVAHGRHVDAAGDLQAVAFESHYFARIVGDDAHFKHGYSPLERLLPLSPRTVVLVELSRLRTAEVILTYLGILI